MITMEKIIRGCATRFDVSTEALMGSGRTSSTVMARHLAWYLCRRELNWSLSEIGRRFSRDHSTVMHGVDRWSKLAESEWGAAAIDAVLDESPEQQPARPQEYVDEVREILRALRERVRDQERQIAAQRQDIKVLNEELAAAKRCDPREVRAKVLAEVHHQWVESANMATFTEWLRRTRAA